MDDRCGKLVPGSHCPGEVRVLVGKHGRVWDLEPGVMPTCGCRADWDQVHLLPYVYQVVHDPVHQDYSSLGSSLL